MEMKSSFLIFHLFFILINLISAVPTDIKLNEAIKNSLPDKNYYYYKLEIPELKSDETKFLLVEARRNEEQDLLDNVFSNPSLYISTKDIYPGPNKNTWSSSRFGDEIISVNQNYVKSKSIFYISIYCEFKCNYILDAKLYNNYSMKEDKLYTISMIPNDVIKFSFKSRKDFEQVAINCFSSIMKPFRIFVAKKDPSSSNTFPSNPIFINGYYFLIKKGDEYYANEQDYEILIENKEFKQDLLFSIVYDNEETELSELSPLFGSAFTNTGNCYSFNIDKQHQNKNIIISTSLFNGNGYIKMGGWDKVKDMKVITEDKNTYPIISDKSILLTETNFKNYGDFKENNNALHFCFIASEPTSYILKIYYQENSEKAQNFNYLLPGMITDDLLPGNNLTKYQLLYFEQNKDIKIGLKIKNGFPKLYAFYSYEDNNYLNKSQLNKMKEDSLLITSNQIYYRNYEIKIEKLNNQCILEPNKGEIECNIYVVIDCDTFQNCEYELFFDHIGDIIKMKPKVLYSNVITEKEVDKYEISIYEDNIKNFAVILTQNTGNAKLKFGRFISDKSLIDFENTEQFNKDYMPNVIEIRSKDFPLENIKGKFEIEVIGYSFSSYDIYYYTFDDDNSHRLDHKTISMSLIKGKIVQDYIKENHYMKVYSYDNSNSVNQKTDLFIYFDSSVFYHYQIYVFKNLNDYSYENEKVKGFLYQSNYYNYIHIEKDDPNYIIGNLYIMVFYKKNDEYYYNSNIVYKKDNTESPFLLVITDENTPITLLEGIEFRQALTATKLYQTFYYNHQQKDEDFVLSVNVPYSKVKIGVKIEEKDYLYEKIIIDNYYLAIKPNDINEYCPSSKSCNIEIRVEASNNYDLDLEVTLLCKSSKNSIVYLNKNGQIEKRKIINNEKQYFVVEVNPSEGVPITINANFNFGAGIIYGKKAEKNVLIEQSIFPNEEKYEYISDLNNTKEEISILTIPYDDIKDHLPCKILVTIKATFYYIGRSQGEYSLSVSNIVDDIFLNRNYRLFLLKGQIKYYHFIVKGDKKRLSISMTNKDVDAYIYLNYATMNKEITDFQWKSEGGYNEYIDINVDDPFFVSRKIHNLEGDYYMAIRSFKDTYFNIFISDSNTKIMTIAEQFPGACTCENENDFCYFRYENINSLDIAEVMEQEMVFYFDFTYGSAEIYASLFEDGNIGNILENLPTQYIYDYKSQYSNQYLRIKLTPANKKYTLDSVLILGTKCKTKSMFDFNVRALIKSGDIYKYSNGLFYLVLDEENVFFINKNIDKPLNLTIYSEINLPLTLEVRALSGSATIHCFIDNNDKLFYDDEYSKRINGYKHISEFSIDGKDSLSYFETITPENSYLQNLYFEVKTKSDCLFSIQLHYTKKFRSIPMSKQIQGILSYGQFYGYIELLPEYEEIILSVDKMHSKSKYSIYLKTNIYNAHNFTLELNYHLPLIINYDIKYKTNEFSPSLNIKIKNLPKDVYGKGKKVISSFYIEAENSMSYNDRLNIIAYPNVEHFELIYPQPFKYIFSSLSSKNVDSSIFVFKKSEPKNNILIIEISSCQGDFAYRLTNKLPTNKEDILQAMSVESHLIEENGKKLIFTKMSDEEYYLSIFGIKEDEMLFGKDNKNTDIDFLLYYYTTNKEELANIFYFTELFDYELKGPGYILLNLPDLVSILPKGNEYKLDDLDVNPIITENSNEFEYMNSVCYLVKKYEIIKSQNLYKNYSININKNKNEIEIKQLDQYTNYYISILITYKKTGQFFTFAPLQILPYKRSTKRIVITLLLIFIFILFFIIFYFYRKYRIAKSIVNFEKNDIKNIGTIPKSITELKKVQEEKNKKAKERYNSLTEDSGEL